MMIRPIAAACAGLLLSGCFEMSQDFTFRSDGTADSVITVAVDAGIIAMSEDSKKDKEPWCEADFAETAVEGVSASSKRSTRGSDVVCEVQLSGKTEDLLAAISEAEIATRDDSEKVSLTKVGEEYHFKLRFPPMADDGEDDDDNPMASGMKAAMLSRMTGRVLAFSVKAPQIITTNGTISDDGTVATYSLPMAEAFTSDEATVFRVTFLTTEPSWIDRVWGSFE